MPFTIFHQLRELSGFCETCSWASEAKTHATPSPATSTPPSTTMASKSSATTTGYAVETRSPRVCSKQSRTRQLPSSSSPLTTRRRSGASRNFPRYATAGGSYSPCSTESTRLMFGGKKDFSKNILGNMKRGLGKTRFWSGGKPWKLLVEELVGFSPTGNATKLHKHSETLDY